MKRIAFVAAVVSGFFLLFGAKTALAVNEICDSLSATT